MQHTQHHRIRLAYDQAGDRGSPVILIMGYIGPGRAWRHQIPALSRHHRVAWFDHRGTGDSDCPRGLWTMGDLASDVGAVMDHAGFDTAHVVGVSMGGMVAQEFCLRYPQRAKSLTLIATQAGGLLAPLPTWKGLQVFLRANLAGRNKNKRLDALAELLFTPEHLKTCDREAIREDLADQFGVDIPLWTRLAQFHAVLRHDTRTRLNRLPAELPVLICHGEQDILCRVARGRTLSGLLPKARFECFDDAGHGLIRQASTRVNQILLDHFAAADGCLAATGTNGR